MLVKKLKHDRRAAAIISLPFLAFAVLSFILIRGAMQIILTFFFLSITMLFVGLVLGYDGALQYEKDA